MQNWTEVFQHTPIRSTADKTFTLATIFEAVQGYAATTDVPAMLFVPELMKLHLDAKVPLSPMGNFLLYLDVLQAGRWGEHYQRPGEPQIPGKVVWERHIEHLKTGLPSEKSLFFDAKDGLGALSKALDCEAPKDIPFPWVNDGAAIDNFANELFVKGILIASRWHGCCSDCNMAEDPQSMDRRPRGGL
ncbi:putative NAD dependent epimerase/dehydratase [Seiridium cardinale]